MSGRYPSALSRISSAAVLPVAAKWSLFWIALKKSGRSRGAGLIIGSESEDLPHPQVDPSLAAADVANAFKQLVEIIRHPTSIDGRVLAPLVVHGEALDEILAQALRGPAAELGAARGADRKANGEDGVQIVMLNDTGQLSAALLSNYSEFPNSCLRIISALS